MLCRNVCLIAALVAAFTTNVALAVNVVTLPSYDRKPMIDGEITAQERDGAALTSLTLMGTRSIPKNKTLAIMMIAGDSLYIGVECQDTDPSRITSKVTKENGPVFDDDAVQLLITPSQEGRKDNYYHFAVNSNGVRYSNYMKSDTPVPAWQSAVKRQSWGWSVELLIPMTSFGGTAESLYWRANIARHQTGDFETSCWVDPGTTIHNYRRFGFLRIERASEMARLVRMTDSLVGPRTPSIGSTSANTGTTSAGLTGPTAPSATLPGLPAPSAGTGGTTSLTP